MFKHRNTEAVNVKTYIEWALLACLAGSVNTGGFLACHRFVTHITGFATLAAVDSAHFRWADGLSIITIPVYFLVGVMVSAYLVDRRVQKGKRPRYAIVMGTVTLFLAIAGIAGYLDYFSVFGHEMDLQKDYLFLALLCGASGLQNAALTTASGSTIRTTHLTGTTTDLGIGLVRVLFMKPRDPNWPLEVKVNLQRVGMIVAFMIGSGIGAALFVRIRYLGFLFPASIALYATSVAVRDERIWRALAHHPASESEPRLTRNG